MALLKVPGNFSDYLELTKPGIVLSILLTTFAGFFLAADSWSQWPAAIWLLLGTALSAASAGTLNHYLEHELDAGMERTRDRPLPAKKLIPLTALSFGVFLGLAGIAVLLIFLNALTALLAGLTIALYIWVYTPMKRRSYWNTLIGAIPGALPPLAGWTAGADDLGWVGVSIFAVFFFWQMPHFYALAWMYRDDYAEGGFVMLPVIDKQGRRTSAEILIYGALLIASVLSLGIHISAGLSYYMLTGVLLLFLLYTSLRMTISLDRPAAVKVFLASLFFHPGFVLAVVLDRWALSI